MDRVQPGDKLTIKARDWNAVADVVTQARALGITPPHSDASTSPAVGSIWVRNGGHTAIGFGEAVFVAGSLGDDITHWASLRGAGVRRFVSGDEYAENCTIGIMTRPAPADGGVGVAVVSGLAIAKVTHYASTVLYARPRANTNLLEPAPAGAVRILHYFGPVEEGQDPYWALVCLPSVVPPIAVFERTDVREIAEWKLVWDIAHGGVINDDDEYATSVFDPCYLLDDVQVGERIVAAWYGNRWVAAGGNTKCAMGVGYVSAVAGDTVTFSFAAHGAGSDVWMTRPSSATLLSSSFGVSCVVAPGDYVIVMRQRTNGRWYAMPILRQNSNERPRRVYANDKPLGGNGAGQRLVEVTMEGVTTTVTVPAHPSRDSAVFEGTGLMLMRDEWGGWRTVNDVYDDPIGSYRLAHPGIGPRMGWRVVQQIDDRYLRIGVGTGGVSSVTPTHHPGTYQPQTHVVEIAKHEGAHMRLKPDSGAPEYEYILDAQGATEHALVGSTNLEHPPLDHQAIAHDPIPLTPLFFGIALHERFE